MHLDGGVEIERADFRLQSSSFGQAMLLRSLQDVKGKREMLLSHTLIMDVSFTVKNQAGASFQVASSLASSPYAFQQIPMLAVTG